MTLTARDRRTVLIGAAALLVLLGGNYVLLPWLEQWQAARAQIRDASATLAAWETRRQRHAIQRERLSEVFGNGLHQPLPDVDEARVQFPNTAESIIKRAGLNVRAIHPQPPRAQRDLPGITMVAVQVEGQCQLPQLARGLAELARAEQTILVDRLSVSGDQSRPGQVDVSMVLSTPARLEARP